MTISALEAFDPEFPFLRTIDADPVIEEHREALYVPFAGWEVDRDPGWGLYDRDGRLIRAAAYCRGQQRRLVGQSETVCVPAAAIEDAPDEHYVHAGPLILHYGHFLLASLSRLWPQFGANARFVWFSHAPLEILPHTPYVGACLAGLGLDPGQFRRFTRPTRIARLTVVAPAFEEAHFGHLAFARTCLRIGARLAAERDQTPRPPAYLTRTGLTWGVKSVANEAAVCAALAGLGVEIIEPERLPLTEQIRLFGSNRVVMGTAGSAFHTALFAPPCARLIAIEFKDNENQVLINRLTGARMLHLRPSTIVPATMDGGPIETVYAFPDPAAIARDLLLSARALEHSTS